MALQCCGITDPRYNAENFGRQPRRRIFKVLELALKRERERTNATSWTTARLAQIVTIAASQGKATAPTESFLPYAEERADQRPRLPASVAATLRTLVRRRVLPLPITAFLMEDLQGADVLG